MLFCACGALVCHADGASASGDDCDGDGAFDARFLPFLSRARPRGPPSVTFRSLPRSSLTFTVNLPYLALEDGLDGPPRSIRNF